MTGRHRRQARRGLGPLAVAGALLWEMWLAMAAGHGSAAAPTTALAVGPPHPEVTSVLRRATRASYRTPLPPEPLGVKAVRAALSKVGVPYVWGAKGPSRFDCSGLTLWAWQQAGVILGPDTYTQVRQGVPVPPGQVQAGDLIFPTRSFRGRGPGHVQLAISPTQVVEAPGRGMTVRVTAMPPSYTARRPAAQRGN